MFLSRRSGQRRAKPIAQRASVFPETLEGKLHHPSISFNLGILWYHLESSNHLKRATCQETQTAKGVAAAAAEGKCHKASQSIQSMARGVLACIWASQPHQTPLSHPKE